MESFPTGMRTCAGVVVVALALLCTQAPSYALQTVYVDFDTIKDAFDATGPGMGIPPADEIYDYSTAQRTFILDYLNERYMQHAMEFLEGPKPVAFDDSAVVLNKPGGAGSEGIDFRNLDDDDEAAVNTIGIFKTVFGLTMPGVDYTDADVAIATANLVAHEAEHLMGARHHDAMGPIGSGLGGGIMATDFSPTYPGPSGAGDTPDSITSLHVGGTLSFPSVTTDKFVSERTAIKLLMADDPDGDFVTTEPGMANHIFEMAYDIPTMPFSIEYPFRPPLPPGETELPVAIAGFAGTMIGTIDPTPDPEDPGFLADHFKFFGVAGQKWTIEAQSYILESSGRYVDNADVAILLLDSTGAIVDYYGADAVNDDDDDSGGMFFGATLIDVELPATGVYVVEVLAADAFINGFTGGTKPGTDGGSYELFIYTAETITVTVPEPASAVLLLGCGVFLAGRRRLRTVSASS